MKINRLPAPTWRWMKVNGTEIQYTAGSKTGSCEERLPDGVTKATGSSSGDGAMVKTGLGEEFAGAL